MSNWRNVSLGCLPLAAFAVLPMSQSFAGDPFHSAYPNIIPPQVQFGEYGSKLGTFNEPSDVAVDTDGTIYIAECYNRRIQAFDKSGESRFSFGGSAEFPLKCPQAIGVTPNTIFVADADGYITAYLKDGNPQFRFGGPGAADGKLRNPSGMAVLGERLVVADTANDRIDVFSTKGVFQFSFGVYGTGDGAFVDPRSVAIDPAGSMYIVDIEHRVQKFDRDGKFLKSWGKYGSFSGEFAEPNDITFADGVLYVADMTNHRLQAFDTNGNFLLQWGRHPEQQHQGRGYTHYPTSIAAEPSGKFVIVCEQFEYRCQLFDTVGLRNLAQSNVDAWWRKFPQFHYGGGARIIRHDEMAAPFSASVDANQAYDLMIITEPDLHKAVVFGIPNVDTFSLGPDSLSVVGAIGEDGNGPGKFAMLAMKQANTATAELYLGDAGNNNIQVFSLSSLEYKRTLFKPGAGPGEFNGPSTLSVGADGRNYIGDFHNNRVQVFDPQFNYLFEFGGLGDGPGQMFGPLSSDFSNDFKRLYITDTGNQRVLVFDPEGKFLFSFGHLTRPGEWGGGSFQWPFDVAVAPDGSVYVTDPSLQLVQKFDADGKFIKQWGGWGTKPGQFYKCKGIDVDSRGRVYVIDFGNHRGQIFDSDGNFVALFGEGILYPKASLGPDGTPIK
jgi:DNA-binding beta-propeller fold protein YncE